MNGSRGTGVCERREEKTETSDVGMASWEERDKGGYKRGRWMGNLRQIN